MNSKLIFAVLIALFVMNQFMLKNDSNDDQKNVEQNQKVENQLETTEQSKPTESSKYVSEYERKIEKQQAEAEERKKELFSEESIAKRKAKAEADAEEIKAKIKEDEERRRKEELNKYVEADINILISDAKNNAARANRAYNGKYVKIVGGYVHNIESDGDYISLSGDGSYSLLHVQCFPQNSEVREQIFNLNKGQYVTVYGRISKVGEIVGYRLEMHKIE